MTTITDYHAKYFTQREQKFYFVREGKSALDAEDRRTKESPKSCVDGSTSRYSRWIFYVVTFLFEMKM